MHPSAAESGTAAAAHSSPVGRRRWSLAIALLLFLAGSLLLLKATGVGEAGDAARAPGSAADLGHIHGIGVNSADGQVYVGAHSGVFRVSEQQPPVLVSDRVQDYMGFGGRAEPFPRQWSPRSWSSASVGLIESTDAGVTGPVAGGPGGLPLTAGSAWFCLRLRLPDRRTDGHGHGGLGHEVTPGTW